MFDLADMMSIVDIFTLVTSLVVGFIVGYLYIARVSLARGRFRLIWPLALLVIGTTFFVMLGSVRLIEGSDLWERWIGSALLWTVFSVGSYLGLEVEHLRYLKKNKEDED